LLVWGKVEFTPQCVRKCPSSFGREYEYGQARDRQHRMQDTTRSVDR
jgi:hypothetical protein